MRRDLINRECHAFLRSLWPRQHVRCTNGKDSQISCIVDERRFPHREMEASIHGSRSSTAGVQNLPKLPFQCHCWTAFMAICKELDHLPLSGQPLLTDCMLTSIMKGYTARTSRPSKTDHTIWANQTKRWLPPQGVECTIMHHRLLPHAWNTACRLPLFQSQS